MKSSLQNGKIYTGEEFNNLTKGETFIKILNKKQNHKGFQYKQGLNVDIEPFNPSGTCLPGGLYFANIKNFLDFYSFGESMWRILIPKDAKIYVEENKYKGDKFILEKQCYIEDFSFLNIFSIWLKIRYFFSFCKNQTLEICMEAVKQNGLALEYVREQTQEICMEAVKKEGFALYYVKKQIPEICMQAVKQNGNALGYVEEQTPEICMEAVKQNGNALEWVKEQTREICMEAVKQNLSALDYVNKQITDVYRDAIIQYRSDYLFIKYTKNYGR